MHIYALSRTESALVVTLNGEGVGGVAALRAPLTGYK